MTVHPYTGERYPLNAHGEPYERRLTPAAVTALDLTIRVIARGERNVDSPCMTGRYATGSCGGPRPQQCLNAGTVRERLGDTAEFVWCEGCYARLRAEVLA